MPSMKEKVEITKTLWQTTSWEDVAAFIGPNAESYKSYYDKTKQSMIDNGAPGFHFNWHWPPLIPILGIAWGVARRVWGFVGAMVLAVR
jgi:hypothetical protein